jgi:hypothetical protein
MVSKAYAGGDLKSLSLSLCLSMGVDAYLSEHEQGSG